MALDLRRVFRHPRELENALFILKDGMQGDEKLFDHPELRRLDANGLSSALDMLVASNKFFPTTESKMSVLANTHRLYYRAKPPTIKEFLTEKYLGKDLNDSVLQYVKDALILFMDKRAGFKHLVLYPHIGWGKSFASTLLNLYLVLHMVLMRDPKKVFNLSPATVLAVVFLSYSLDKASETILQPFWNMLEASPVFEKVKTREKMDRLDKEFDEMPLDKVYWTTAHPTAEISFSKGVIVKLSSSVQSLLGLTIACGTMTELSFFRDAGKSEDYIARLLNDLKKRVHSRMDNTPLSQYFGRTLLDSSPNALDGAVDDYVINKAERDPLNLIIRGAQWDWRSDMYDDLDNRFPVHLGNKTSLPRILTPGEAKGYPQEEVLMVPEFRRTAFEDDMIKSIKDYAGIPSGSIDKLFPNPMDIESIFTDNLVNMYMHITAPANLPPEKLIWNQVRDIFWHKGVAGQYEFYRYPRAERFLHIDQSEAKDVAAIAMVHKEYGGEHTGDIFVVDFTIAIQPTKDRINLDAIRWFMVDLLVEGRINLGGVSFDGYESASAQQDLKRRKIPVSEESVDRTLTPYLDLQGLIASRKVKVGRNIYLKNNLKSIRQVQRRNSESRKFDHTQGEISRDFENVNWETSRIGQNAKDVADAVCGAISLCKKLGMSASYEYVDSLKKTFVEDEESKGFYVKNRVV